MKRKLSFLLIILFFALIVKAQTELVSTGSGFAYDISYPAAFSYSSGITITFKAHAASTTGPVTLNINGLGAKTIKKNVTADLALGDIMLNQYVTVIYDGTNFQLTSSLPGSAGVFATAANVTSNSPGNFTLDDFVFGSPQLNNDADVNHYSRMYFDKSKSAFRAGYESGAGWNDVSVGNYSVAMGGFVRAMGDFSAAFGNAYADGDYSAALVRGNTTSNAIEAFSVGYGAYSRSARAFSLGFFADVTGSNSFGLGSYVKTNASNAFVIGTGVNVGSELLNNTANSIMLGSNSNLPTLFIGPSAGVGTTGKIGVGTTNPLVRFSNYDTNVTDESSWGLAGDNTFLWAHTEDGNKGYAAAIYNEGSSSNNNGLLVRINNTTPDESILTLNSGGIDQFKVTGEGLVGIGTTSPTAKLDIGGTAGVDGIRFPDGTLQTTAAGSGWSLTGNSGTNGVTNFIGTVDNVVFNIRVNNVKSGRIDNSTGSNTFFGYETGNVNSGSNNSFFGQRAGKQNSTGSNNTGIGAFTLFNTTTGSQNTAIGSSALASNNGGNNTAIGYSALNTNSTGSSNTAIGSLALNANTTGISNVAIGQAALISNTVGNANTAIGTNSLQSNTGSDNTAVGGAALQSNTSGFNNSAVGRTSLGLNQTGHSNSALGYLSLYSNVGGFENTAVGSSSMESNTSGNQNSSFGVGALKLNSTGSMNTAIGLSSLYNSTASENTGIGYEALSNTSSGGNNTAIGRGAGTINTTGSSNTFLGSFANSSLNNLSNATAIGANAVVSQSNSIVLGNNANVGIGISSPLVKLHVYDNSTTRGGAWQTQKIFGTGTNTTTEGVSLDVYSGVYDGGGVGGDFYGIKSFATWGANNYGLYGEAGYGNAYGVYGKAIAGATNNYGIYGIAANGSNNWAGYFEGRGYFSGNLGIGTNNPTAKLHVAGTAGVDGIRFPDGTLQTSAAVTPPSFWTKSGSFLYPTNSSDYIGIGITNPTYNLDIQSSSAFAQVKSSSAYAGFIIDKANTSQNGYLIFRTAGADNWTMGQQGNLDLSFYNWSNSRNDVTILNASGNVGIATTNPSEKLEVNGNIEIPAANDYKYAAAKTIVMSIPANAFKPLASGNNCAYIGLGQEIYSLVNTNILAAPLSLPDGCTITRLDVYVNDLNTGTISSALVIANTNGGAVNYPTGNSVGATGYQTLSHINSYPVDNSNYNYYINCTLPFSGSQYTICGAKITYTVTKAD